MPPRRRPPPPDPSAALARFEASLVPRVKTDEHPVLAHLDELEQRLVAAGWPPMSPWWRRTFERFYLSRRWRRLVARVGRRGGKSSSLCRIAVLEALYGEHAIPPGDTGFVVFISHTKTEAAERIATVRKILDVLGVAHRPIDSGVALLGRNVAFRVFVATIAGVSGATAICLIFDELAKWRDASTGANPATEVLNSARPMAATMRDAREFMISSPLGTLDAHAKAMAEGETSQQATAEAPTWETNPTLTEEDTHALEPDPRIHAREYGAVPLEGDEESIFLPAVLDLAERDDGRDLPPEHGWSYVGAIDPATRGNAWTLVLSTRDATGRRIVVLRRQWQGTPSKPLDPDVLFAEMMGAPAKGSEPAVPGLLTPYGITRLQTDEGSGFDALSSIARKRGLYLELKTIDNLQAYGDAAVKMRNREIEIPKDPALRADLLGVFRVVTANGLTVRLKLTGDGRHCDYAPSFVRSILAHCALPRALPRTPDEKAEADALAADQRRYGPKKKGWWERGGRLPR